jgi:hypothetical protein
MNVSMLVSAALSAAIVLSFCLLGAAALLAMREINSTPSVAAYSFPLGSGLLTFSLFVLSRTGIYIRVPMVILTYFVILWIFLTIGRVRFGAFISGRLQVGVEGALDLPGKLSFVQWILWFLLAILFFTFVFLAVGKSYFRYDAAVGWGLKGYAIAYTGEVCTAGEWGTWGLAYPLNIPLQVSIFKLLDGDLLPGSKLIFPFYSLSLILGMYLFWREHGVSKVISLLSMLFVVTIPIIFYQSTLGYANLPFACTLTLGIIGMFRGIRGKGVGVDWLAGTMFSVASWTRAEAAGYVLIVVLMALTFNKIRRKQSNSLTKQLFSSLLVLAFWIPFARDGIESSHLGEAITGVLPKIWAVQLNLNYLRLTLTTFLRRAIDPKNWGFFLPATTILFMAGTIRRRRSLGTDELTMILVSIVIALIPFGLFYIRSFSRWTDFEALIIRSFDRAFIPGAIMLILVSVWLFAGRVIAEHES